MEGSDKIHSALSIIEQQVSILQVALECKKKGRKTDDKQSFVNSYFVSISDSIESKIRSVNKLTKYLSFQDLQDAAYSVSTVQLEKI